MKKTAAVIISFLLSLLLTFPALAGTMDLARADREDLRELKVCAEEGQRLFDQAGVLTEQERTDIQGRLLSLEQMYGQGMIILLVKNQELAPTLERYCDEVYSASFTELYGGDGILLVKDYGDEAHYGTYIYAKNGAERYITDRAVDQLFDRYQGGISILLKNGRNYEALCLYTDFLEALYRQQTPGKNRVKLWQVIAAAAAAAVSGLIAVVRVKRQYALVQEKRQAANVNLAYRTTAAFTMSQAADALVSRRVVHVPIPRQESGGGGPALGGGHATTHTSVGGGTYSGGGRKV